jgi:hypothetical protein
MVFFVQVAGYESACVIEWTTTEFFTTLEEATIATKEWITESVTEHTTTKQLPTQDGHVSTQVDTRYDTYIITTGECKGKLHVSKRCG